MLMEPDEYTPQERALTDKAKELIEQHELDWGNGECFIQRDAGHLRRCFIPIKATPGKATKRLRRSAGRRRTFGTG